MATTVNTKNIKNVCLLGHGGNGKTSLVESMLYLAKETDRLGKISDGNTVSDYDPEETKRKFSISASVVPVMWKNSKINFLDTPGTLDFAGEVMQSLRVCGTALIVMDAKSGVDVGSELAWERATALGVPKAFFINKMDDDNANFGRTIEQMREVFGQAICPVAIPIIVDRKPLGFADLITMKGYEYVKDGSQKEMNIPEESMQKILGFRDMLMEALALTGDELMEKFFAGEAFTEEEMFAAMNKGIIDGTIAPVMVGSASTLMGIAPLLNIIADSFPNPLDRKGERDENGEEVKPDPNGETAVFVFKTIADPFVGKMSFFKVMNGTLKKDMTLTNRTNGTAEKFAHIYMIRGKKQTEVDEIVCGDIGMTAKLAATGTNDTLGGPKNYAPVVFPHPYLRMAIVPKAKGDEDKISTAVARMLEEDPTLCYENNAETKQMLLYGLGDTHLDVVVSKLKSRYGANVELVEARVPYRETIKKRVQVEGKHKKQSGGSGQYGHVKITFSPGEAEGLTFTQSVVGGSVPKGFYPAVEKGLLEAMQKGVLAGFPVVNLAADLFDGSYHPVDSNEISFKLAAKLAYKEGLPKANPVILEPVGTLKVRVPDGLVGDVIGDLNKRRGRVLGMNPDEHAKGRTIVEAEVPMAEMANYTIALRALSQGRGVFDYEFTRYEEAPANVAQKIIEDAKKNAVEE
ncbi:MAG: elongation factor G [Eubacteriales bacterium]